MEETFRQPLLHKCALVVSLGRACGLESHIDNLLFGLTEVNNATILQILLVSGDTQKEVARLII